MKSNVHEKSTFHCGTGPHHLYNAITEHSRSVDPSLSRGLQGIKLMGEKARKEEDLKVSQHHIKLPRFKADILRRFLMTCPSNDQSRFPPHCFLNQKERFPKEKHSYALLVFGSPGGEKINPSSSLAGEGYLQRDQVIPQNSCLPIFILRSSLSFNFDHLETEKGSIDRYRDIWILILDDFWDGQRTPWVPSITPMIMSDCFEPVPLGLKFLSNQPLKRLNKFMVPLLHPELLSQKGVSPYKLIGRTSDKRKHDRNASWTK